MDQRSKTRLWEDFAFSYLQKFHQDQFWKTPMDEMCRLASTFADKMLEQWSSRWIKAPTVAYRSSPARESRSALSEPTPGNEDKR